MRQLGLLLLLVFCCQITVVKGGNEIVDPEILITPYLQMDPSLSLLQKDEITGTSMLPPWSLEGSAVETSSGCLLGFQLTTAVPAIKGCVWDNESINFGSDDLDYTFEANFGSSDAGADGICLVFRDTPSGCGQGGGGIGSGGLTNSFIVEFDTWDNGPGLGDIPDDHVSVDINGDLTMPIAGPVSLGNIEDGMNHEIRFVWSAGSQTFEIYFDGSLKITGVYDIASLFGGGIGYLGFTASTGGAFNNQSVFPGDEIGPPDPPVFTQYDVQVCENETGVIYKVQQEPGITYTWTVPPGASISGSGNSITVNFGSESGEVCAVASNSCEESDPVCVYVEVIPLPDIIVEQPKVICEDQFDLKDVVLSGLEPTQIVTYYATQAAANAGSPQLSSTIVFNSGTYWARIATPEGCFVVVSIDVMFEVVDIEVIDPKPICEPNYVNLPADVMVIENNGLNLEVINFFASQSDAINGSPVLVNLNVTQSGIYWVRAETINGCFAVGPVNVIINLKPEIIISPPVIQCLGDTLDLNTLVINDSKGTDPNDLINSFYLKMSDAVNKVNALSPAQIWYATTIWVRSETAEGCFDVESINIQFKPASVATISGSNTFCKDDNAVITINFMGQAPFSGSFGNGTTVIPFNTNNKTFTYTIQVGTDQTFKLLSFMDGSANSCPPVMQGEAILTLFKAPVLQTIVPAPLCKDSIFNIEFVLDKYFPANINFNLDGINLNTNSDSAGFYPTSLKGNSELIIKSITDVNGCTYNLNDTTIITVHNPPSVSNIKETCNNTEFFIVSFDISGGDPSSYTVNGSVTGIVNGKYTSNLIPNKTNYSFSIDDGNGCGPIIITGYKDCSCETDAGSMNLNPLDFCIDQADSATHNKDQVLDSNDNLLFVLHDGNGSSLGFIYAVNSVPFFPFNPVTMTAEVVYYISAVAGNGSGPGMIDLNDPCLSVATGTPVIYHNLPTLTASDITICEGDSATIKLNFTGNGPYNITVKKDGQAYTTFQTNSLLFDFNDNPAKDAIYSFSISDKYCNGAVPLIVKATVKKKVQVLNIVHTCSLDKQFYTVKFTIVNGNQTGYSVTGVTGILTGSNFTSDNIASGSSYNITVSDGQCEDYIFSGTFTCACETEAGQLAPQKHICIGDTVNLNLSGSFLDANDTLIYIINDKSKLDLQNNLGIWDNSKIWFDSTKFAGNTGIWIFAIAGNKLKTGIGIDTTDPCLDYTKSVYINFYYVPEFYLLVKDTVLECGKFSVNINMQALNPIYGSQTYKYWSTLNGNIVSIDSTFLGINATVNKNGTYTLKLLNNKAGCSFTKDIIINIQNEDPIIKVNHFEKIGCQINQLKLNALGSSFGNNFVVQWSTNSGNIVSGIDQLDPIIDKAGIYYISISDAKTGCTVLDSVLVDLIPSIYADNIIIKSPSCSGKSDGSINIVNIGGGIPPYKYELNGNSVIGSNYTGLDNGNFDINISDAFGCTFDTNLILDAPSLIDIEIGEDITVEWGSLVSLNADLSIPLNDLDTLIWFNLDSANCSFCIDPQFIATKNTLVKAVAIKNACQDDDEKRVIVKKIHDVFIPNTFSPNADGVNDRIVIYGGKNVVKVHKFEIFNRWGGRIFSAENFYPDGLQGGWNGKLGNQYLNESVFVYYAQIEFIDGDIEIFKGDITLMR